MNTLLLPLLLVACGTVHVAAASSSSSTSACVPPASLTRSFLFKVTFRNATPAVMADGLESANDIAVYLFRNTDPIFTKPGVIANQDSPLKIDYETLVVDDTRLGDKVQVVFADYITSQDRHQHERQCNWLNSSETDTCSNDVKREAFCFNMFFDRCVTFSSQFSPPQEELGRDHCNIPRYACPDAGVGAAGMANFSNAPPPKFPCPVFTDPTKGGWAWGVLWRECASNYNGPLLAGLNPDPPWRNTNMNFIFSPGSGACDFLHKYYATEVDGVAAAECASPFSHFQRLGSIDVTFPPPDMVDGWAEGTFGNKDTWSDAQVKQIDQGGTASYQLKFWAARCECGEFVSPEGYCKRCQPGEYCPDGFSVHSCDAGSSQDAAGASACVPCEKGHFQSDTGKTACFSCDPGTVALKEGEVTCTPCADNMAASPDGTSCSGCVAGKAPSDSGCAPCPAGTYSAGNAAACSPCNAGRYASGPDPDAPGQTSPTCEGECDPGYYCPAGSASATAKKCGHAAVYCAAGSAAPTVCPAGSYTTSCAVAQDGSGQLMPGDAGCTPQDKTTDPASTRSSCVKCDPGHGCKNGVKKTCEDYNANADEGGSRCAGDADLLVSKKWRSWAIASWALMGTMCAVICFRRVQKPQSHRSRDSSTDRYRDSRSTLSSPSEDSLGGIQMRENPISRPSSGV